jgi:hypothetical protein
MIKGFLVKHKFLLILIFVFLFLRLPSLFEPYWYGDEGIYLSLGQGIRKGLVLYSQIHDNKPPSLYYLAAISQTVFGFRLLLLIWMISTIYLFWKLSQALISKKNNYIVLWIFLILTSVPFIEGNIANAEIFMLLPTIAGILLALKSKKTLNLFFSGLLLGFAFTIKVPVLIEFGFLFLWIFIENKKDFKLFKNLFYLSLGFVLPILFYAAYFYYLGAFNNFIFAALLQNFGYLSSWAQGTHSASIGQGGLFTRLIILVFFWLIIFFLKIKKIISVNLSFILFWFGAAFFGALLSGRPYPHYLIQTLPPLCLLLGILFSKEKSKILILISLAFYILFIFQYKFYYYRVFSYYSNFYSYSLSLKNRPSYLKFFGGNVENNEKISAFIKNNSNSNDRIFVWGDEPYIYSLSDRLPVTKYTVAYHIVDFNDYQNTIKNLETYRPKFIVYYQMPNRPFIELDKFIINNYFLSQKIGGVFVYQIK